MSAPGTTPILRATHEGVLVLGDVRIECAVLPGGRRVVSESSFAKALGRDNRAGHTYRNYAKLKGFDKLPGYLTAASLKSAIPEGFSLSTIQYTPANGSGLAIGIDALAIPAVCSIWLRARRAKLLRKNQQATAARAEIIQDGLAVVGITALIDEVTGYQAVRGPADLQRIANTYFAEAPRPWRREFPDEFFREIHRVNKWPYREGQTTHPSYMGQIIKRTVYEPMPEPVLQRLHKQNPRVDGRRRRKHHQLLSKDVGVPELAAQIQAVTMIARGSVDRVVFDSVIARAFPRPGDQLSLGTAEMPPMLR